MVEVRKQVFPNLKSISCRNRHKVQLKISGRVKHRKNNNNQNLLRVTNREVYDEDGLKETETKDPEVKLHTIRKNNVRDPEEKLKGRETQRF